jgi:two-component system OmpR family response regulator
MRILLAEDDSVLADGLTRSLRQSGYAIDCVGNGQEADTALSTQEFDLLILDLGLPKLSGLEVLRRLRARARAAGADPDGGRFDRTARQRPRPRRRRLHGQAVCPVRTGSARGADAARRRRRRHHHQARPAQLRPGGRSAYINEQMLDLSARELGLLEILLARTGRLVSKEQLVDHLCEWGEEVSNNAIEVYVHRLRKKIEVGGIRIATVRGLGYCLGEIRGTCQVTKDSAVRRTPRWTTAARGGGG